MATNLLTCQTEVIATKMTFIDRWKREYVAMGLKVGVGLVRVASTRLKSHGGIGLRTSRKVCNSPFRKQVVVGWVNTE